MFWLHRRIVSIVLPKDTTTTVVLTGFKLTISWHRINYLTEAHSESFLYLNVEVSGTDRLLCSMTSIFVCLLLLIQQCVQVIWNHTILEPCDRCVGITCGAITDCGIGSRIVPLPPWAETSGTCAVTFAGLDDTFMFFELAVWKK